MVQPFGIDLIYWAGTLFVDFPHEDIPVLIDPAEWKGWGNDLIACPQFTLNDAPATDFYNDWESWAWDIYYCMANYA